VSIDVFKNVFFKEKSISKIEHLKMFKKEQFDYLIFLL